jgi:type II secretory pathway pseudopilin PulG
MGIGFEGSGLQALDVERGCIMHADIVAWRSGMNWGSSALHRTRRPGFTAIESLVVCAVILVLLSLLTTSLQAARESARLVTCTNNARTLANGWIELESLTGHMPSGGWGANWVGSGQRPADQSQPGSWAFSILPSIGEQDLRDAITDATPATAEAVYRAVAETTVPQFCCPSRSNPMPQAIDAEVVYLSDAGTTIQIAKTTPLDYAANGGSAAACPPLAVLEASAKSVSKKTTITFCHVPPGNPRNGQTLHLPLQATVQGHLRHSDTGDHLGACFSCEDDMDRIARQPTSLAQGDQRCKMPPTMRVLLPDDGVPDLQDGVLFRMSSMSSDQLHDGATNTYLLGEKYADPVRARNGRDPSNDAPWFVGYSSANVRWTRVAPAADRRGEYRPSSFGSSHKAGWTAAFADGRVVVQKFDIDPEVHRALGGRANSTGCR